MERKAWCSILEGAIYDEHCLFKLSQTVPGNRSCEQCILFENLQLRGKLEEAKNLLRRRLQRKPSRGKPCRL
jgi:hypothetical protein